ncbi:MAG: hypothetical protein ACJAR7_001331, partial [Polaromonas sp.]
AWVIRSSGYRADNYTAKSVTGQVLPLSRPHDKATLLSTLHGTDFAE